LKKWIAREAGVEWPSGRKAEIGDVKRVVIVAQRRRLADLGVAVADRPFDSFDDEMQTLGRQLRAELAKRGKP